MANNKVKALYAGTFDPVTDGHLDIVRRTVELFDDVVVGVYDLPQKSLMFNTKERVDLFKRALSDVPQVEITAYSGLTVRYAAEIGAHVLVRGLRIGADYEYEREMALMNRAMQPNVETICLMSSLEQQFISSSRIKEIAKLGAEIDNFVPPHVSAAVAARISNQ
ncbi:MAG TPA: pantetheine-phosphate adenylyltransferase [Dehalococcoidia bacterium]|nr:pantetheine-phosphate adenylyltransferase [Dehalococcoidia bacterium]